jgi:hypothetical protein
MRYSQPTRSAPWQSPASAAGPRAHLVGPEQTEASHAVLTTLHHPGNQDEEELSELSGAGNRAA